MHDEAKQRIVVGPRRVRVSGGCVIAPARKTTTPFLQVELDPVALLGPDRGRRLDPLSQFALVVVEHARKHAGLPAGSRSDRLPCEGVVVGTALAAEATCVRYSRRLVGAGPAATNPIDFPDSIDGGPAGHVSLEFGLGGPSLTFVDGQASARSALVHAARLIAWGRATRMYVVVGDKFDALLGFAIARDPEFACDSPTDGCVPAECVVGLVLEACDLRETTEDIIEVVGFLDDSPRRDPSLGEDSRSNHCERPGDASREPDGWAAPLTWFLDASGTVQLACEVVGGCRRLRDPSGALVLSGAWLHVSGSADGLFSASDHAVRVPQAAGVLCDGSDGSRLGFIRSSA